MNMKSYDSMSVNNNFKYNSSLLRYKMCVTSDETINKTEKIVTNNCYVSHEYSAENEREQLSTSKM